MKLPARVRAEHILVIVLAASAFSLLCLWGGAFTRPEYVTWDWRERLSAAHSTTPDSDVVIVAIDQESLDWLDEELHIVWPVPREFYRRIADFCRRAQCAGLMFDMFFSEASPYGAEDDEALGDSLGLYGKAVVAAGLGEEEGKYTALPEWLRLPPLRSLPETVATFPAAKRALLPVESIAARSFAGNVQSPPDEDGVHRRISLFTVMGGVPVPGLAMAGFLAAQDGCVVENTAGPAGDALRLRGNDGSWQKHIPLDENGSAILSFRGGRGSFPFLNAAAVVRSELRLLEGEEPFIPLESLKGKYVIVGVTAPGLFDRARSPMEGFMSGVEVQATVLDNILREAFVKPVRPWVFLPLLFLVPLALAFAFKASGGLAAQAAVWSFGLLSPVALGLLFSMHGVWLPMFCLGFACVLTLLATSMFAYAVKAKQRQHLEKAFKHYLAPTVVQRILDSGADVGLHGTTEVVSVLFSDIRGFTALSEKLEAGQVVRLLNAYFKPMTDCVVAHAGTLDKFVGDALMAFWNAPEKVFAHESKAVAAALAMRKALAELNVGLEKELGVRLQIGIGLHSGAVHVGNMGTDTFMDYTIIGDTVNLASRLEGLCRVYDVSLVVSEDVRNACEGQFVFQKIGRQRVKGREEPVTIYTVHEPGEENRMREELRLWHEAVALFEQRRFAAAAGAVSPLYRQTGKGLYKHFMTLCSHYGQSPPEPSWDGTVPTSFS